MRNDKRSAMMLRAGALPAAVCVRAGNGANALTQLLQLNSQFVNTICGVTCVGWSN